jgi:hypothetical protein
MIQLVVLILALIGRERFRPTSSEHRAVLRVRHVVLALEEGIDEVASSRIVALIQTATSTVLPVVPLHDAEVGVLAMAVERSLDGGAVIVDLACVSENIGQGHPVDDILDVGVGAGDDDLEVLLELAFVHGDVGRDGAAPETALDLGGGRGVAALRAREHQGSALVVDGEGVT